MPRAVDDLIEALHSSVQALEDHVTAMNYRGTDEFNAHTITTHPFEDQASEQLSDLAGRVQQLSDDLYSAAEERRSFAELNPAEQSARTEELENLADAARIDEWEQASWRLGAADREAAWRGLPPENTAPGRCGESVRQCPRCGGSVETVDGVRRCWTCYRRGQNGR